VLKPKVYFPQIPSRFDSTIKVWVPTINPKPAEEFGDVVVVLPPDASRLGSQKMAEAVRTQMADYVPGDFIVGAGDPTIIAMCAIQAALHHDAPVNMLKWDRQTSSYQSVEIDL
jgi:hypothetical protein